ncbi:MAG: hypothetical protein SF097_19440 [Acidobacteriota bacterium]|nr:hypothetical protein [Acidobacteriota bacterium]
MSLPSLPPGSQIDGQSVTIAKRAMSASHIRPTTQQPQANRSHRKQLMSANEFDSSSPQSQKENTKMISVITALSLNLSEEFRVVGIVPAAGVVGQQRFRQKAGQIISAVL